MTTNAFFDPYILGGEPRAGRVGRILAAALRAVDPYAAVRAALDLQGETLTAGKWAYDLSQCRRVLVVGAGKASRAMAAGVESVLGERISAGVVIAKGPGEETFTPAGRIRIRYGEHPVPGAGSLEATRAVLDLLASARLDDLVICLISGGGSALLTAPAPGVSLADLQVLTRELLACGAAIQEINALRKHLDQAKGGGLLRAAGGARVLTLILSDVVGSPLDVIASGPTVPDASTFTEALDVLARYGVRERVPAGVIAYLEGGARGDQPETLKAGDPLLDRAEHRLVGSNALAAAAALDQAQREGFHPLLLTTFLEGEASQAGRFLAGVLRQAVESGQPLPRPACIAAGGETTVTLRGKGRGGRNQELALAAVDALAGLEDVALVTLATDGEDGTTGAAGAVVTGRTGMDATKLGLRASDYLAENDSFSYFEALGGLVRTGSTGTNVNDLTFLFTF